MQPVFDSRPVGDILLAAAAKSSSAKLPWTTTADAVKAECLALASKADTADSEDFWVKVRREGGLFEEQHLSALTLDTSPFKAAVPTAAQMELSVYVYPHIFLYDGRGADKPWLQELPEPVTQLVWDSWAEIHPDTARSLGVAQDDVVELKTEHGMIEAPALVQRTVRPGVIAVPLGQGHHAYGRYAKDVGANAWAIMAAGATYSAVTARATGET